MPSLLSLTSGAALVAAVATTIYTVTAHRLWTEVATALVWWAATGGVMNLLLAAGAWKTVLNTARADRAAARLAADGEPESTDCPVATEPAFAGPVVAGYVGPRDSAENRRRAA